MAKIREEVLCSVCGVECSNESFIDDATGDICCTECCFYDGNNDVYHKGTIEEHLAEICKANEVVEQTVTECLSWFERREVQAYSNGNRVYVMLENEDENHIEIAAAEIEYRANLWRELQEEAEEN